MTKIPAKLYIGAAARSLPNSRRLLLMTMAFFGLTLVNFGQQKAGDMQLEPIVFENAKKQRVEAERGRLFVLENRRRPNSRLIELAFVRFKSTAKQPGAPVVYLAGGPGGSGIEAARGTRFDLFMAMREFGDVIAFDQRGTGASIPNLNCPEPLDFPLDQPSSRQSWLKLYREESLRCAGYWQAKNVDLTAYNTNESADDLESLRISLGAPKISLWGISYGTHLGLATIRRHGKRIERAILAGVEGPDQSLKLSGAYRQHLRDIGLLVAADPEVNRVIPDFLALVNKVMTKLDKEPAIVETIDPKTRQKVKVVINGFLFRQFLNNLYGTESIQYIPYFFNSASKGDYSLLTYLLLSNRSSIGSAMPYMMDCSSGASSRRRLTVRRESTEFLFGDLNFPFMDVCNAWGNPDLGKTFRSPVKSNVPVLFISGTLDAKTQVGNAEEIKLGFPKSTHLIVEGAVHSDPLFLSSPRIKDVMMEFMKNIPVSTTRITIPPVRFIMNIPLPSK